MQDKNCIFCKIVNREIPAYIVYEDDKTLAFLDLRPSDNGHTLVISKDHTACLSESPDSVIVSVARTRKKVGLLLKSKLKPKGFNYVSNDGAEAFQQIFHYHEHVIPKYVKTEGYAPGCQPFKEIPIAEIYDKLTK